MYYTNIYDFIMLNFDTNGTPYGLCIKTLSSFTLNKEILCIYHKVNKNISNLVWILTQFKLKIKIKSLVAWSNFESWLDQIQTFNFVQPKAEKSWINISAMTAWVNIRLARSDSCVFWHEEVYFKSF